MNKLMMTLLLSYPIGTLAYIVHTDWTPSNWVLYYVLCVICALLAMLVSLDEKMK